MVEYRIMIPKADNNGVEFPEELHEETREELIDKFGGLTVVPWCRGFWKQGDTVIKDHMDMYIVCGEACDNWLLQFSYDLKFRYRQDAIFITESEVTLI